MNIESILLGFAQIAVVLIGFSSVFLTFLMRDTKLDAVMRMHARALIMVAPLTLALAITPLVLIGFELKEIDALRWSLAIVLVPGTPTAVLNNFYFLKLSIPDRKRTGYWHMVLANAIALGVLILSGVVFFTDKALGAYIGIIVLVTLGSVLALFTSFIDELSLFRDSSEKK
jgi:hypothetical protein